MPRFEKQPSEYVEKLVSLNRVSKTVKGGPASIFFCRLTFSQELL